MYSHWPNGYGEFHHVTEDMITSPNNIERFFKLFYYRVLSVSPALLLRNQKNSLHSGPSTKLLGTVS